MHPGCDINVSILVIFTVLLGPRIGIYTCMHHLLLWRFLVLVIVGD